MKKARNKIIAVLLLAAALFLYYYAALPAINIHSIETWWFILIGMLIISVLLSLRSLAREQKTIKKWSELSGFIHWKHLGIGKLAFLLTGIMLLALMIGTILSSPIINAKKYQQLMTVEERNFTDDITQADFNTIPILDKDSAALLGDRKMGSMVDMVSQFEVSDDYTQINVNNRPVRVTPLSYANTIKWLTNQSSGIPAYIKIDMATQDTECVKLNEPIKYSKSEHFNRNIYRHLRFQFPTYIFDDHKPND